MKLWHYQQCLLSGWRGYGHRPQSYRSDWIRLRGYSHGGHEHPKGGGQPCRADVRKDWIADYLAAGLFARAGHFAAPVREFHIERTNNFIDLARTWNAKNVLLVLGEYTWQREVIPPQAQWQWALETCRRIGDYADGKKIDIALELEPFRLSLLNNVDAMARFVDECNHPRVRANIDISHLVLSDTSPAEVKKLKGKAIHVHLSDWTARCMAIWRRAGAW